MTLRASYSELRTHADDYAYLVEPSSFTSAIKIDGPRRCTINPAAVVDLIEEIDDLRHIVGALALLDPGDPVPAGVRERVERACGRSRSAPL